jgi:hypothetical protein
VWLSLRPALLETSNDFANYYAPARALADGRRLDRLYERDALQREVERAGLSGIGSFVPHPPANALLLAPLARLEPLPAKAAWTLLLALAYAATWPVLRALCGLPPLEAALVMLVPTASLANALAYGQPYPLLLLLLSASLLGVARGRALVGGLALAPVLLLKLYAAPHALFLLLSGRWRAALGLLAGASAMLALSLGVLGAPLHLAYLREVLPASLRGEIQDPYSPLWGSVSSLSHRLFQFEPDLNPRPASDAPMLVAPVARALEALLLLLALVARPPGEPASALRRHWAALTLAALAASPLLQSYHYLLLVLPVALLLGEQPPPLARWSLLALLAFATSPLPHYFTRFAAGWANLLAYPRLYAVCALLAYALRGTLGRTRLVGCIAAALVVGALQPAPSPDPGWQRIPTARGYLMAEPVACGGRLGWITIAGDRFVFADESGAVLRGAGHLLGPRCDEGRLRFGVHDPADGRLSPDGRSLLVPSWEEGSWDIRVVDRASGTSRRLTRDPANEVEPTWSEDGRAVLFASDRRRGLGSTALYRLELR